MAHELIVGDIVCITVQSWFADKHNIRPQIKGKVRHRTEKAVYLDEQNDGIWIPLSCIIFISNNLASMEETAKNEFKPWVVSEYEGYTNRLIRDYRFATEIEAKKAWDDYRQSNKFAGVGGKWIHYFSYPRKEQLKKEVK